MGGDGTACLKSLSSEAPGGLCVPFKAEVDTCVYGHLVVEGGGGPPSSDVRVCVCVCVCVCVLGGIPDPVGPDGPCVSSAPVHVCEHRSGRECECAGISTHTSVCE